MFMLLEDKAEQTQTPHRVSRSLTLGESVWLGRSKRTGVVRWALFVYF